MEQTDLLRLTVNALERLEIPYAIVGSIASGVWGESRFTQDIDILIDLASRHVSPLCGELPDPEFYVSQDAARDAISTRGQFNVIHPTSGNKIVFIVAGRTAWAAAQLKRQKRLRLFPDQDAYFSAPEDVILSKLVYYREGSSDKHLRDITGILKVSGQIVDRAYIQQFAAQLGISDLWQSVQDRIGDA